MAIERYNPAASFKVNYKNYIELQKEYGEKILKMIGLLYKLSDHLDDKYQECVDLVNQYLKSMDSNWINNGDGTFTAKEGATLWELQQATGRDWKTSDYQGDPKKLQIGQKVSLAAKNKPNSFKTIDSTEEAFIHYYRGKGEPVNIGPKTVAVLQAHPRQVLAQKNITEGITTEPNKGFYKVEMPKDKQSFWIGNTHVDYSATYGNKFAIIDFSGFTRDGFWDVSDPLNLFPEKADGPGPNLELPGGKVYAFIPYNWTISGPNPLLK